MKKFLIDQMTRRKFKDLIERFWLAVFLVPRVAKAQCCFNVYIDCQTTTRPIATAMLGFLLQTISTRRLAMLKARAPVSSVY